ncbi:hypothetical protein HN748_01780 [Candidatus Peregrinibacteria bacterium]|jgi:peptide/nickel transport system substrate-binding protein|nr:hypothetical protein [Candidatus Peregrinibacteria bacterium]MBT7483687.1 hypothetical protein [Candidatus Peregrinibacteria bacterium]MBT7702942.1 hypothetical protein [Candidatus Peregrinibacteria bacterium]
MADAQENQNQKKLLLNRVDMIVGAVFLTLITITGVAMFSLDSSSYLYGDVTHSEEIVRDSGSLEVVYDQSLETYDPTASGVVTRGYLANVYEGLVRFDQDFNVEPALALSWGMLDDTTWQFKLRPDVKFHDGSDLEPEDVKESIERAQTDSDSQIQDLVKQVKKVEIIDDLILQIETKRPDPTLLNKLALLPVVPADLKSPVVSPIGTGPYVFLREVGDSEWEFERFSDYWGDLPSFPELSIKWITDKLERYESLVSGEVDVLGQVPPIFVGPLLEQGYMVASLPSLEVHFFMFDSEGDDSPFRHKEVREAVASALDLETLTSMASEFAEPATQFVSRGVFGYNSDLDSFEFDASYAREQLRSTGKNEWEVTLDLPEGLEGLGDYVVEQLDEIGIEVLVNTWSAEDYENLIRSGDSDFYFLAWRSDAGDSTDFFTNIVHSEGDLNGGGFADEGVDQLIEAMEQNVFETTRLEQLQQLMELVTKEWIIGVPLFETDSLIGVSPDLDWEPRMDNLILANDFS